jgi:hypothetical protein
VNWSDVFATAAGANSMLCPSGFPELAAMTLRLEHREIPDDRIEMLRTAFWTTSFPVARGLSIEKTALQVFVDQSSNWGSVARINPAQSFREGEVFRPATGSAFEKVGRDGELKIRLDRGEKFDVQNRYTRKNP